jgi:hypothetical protein
MPEFLAEAYTPRGAPGTSAPSAADIARAADQASGPGDPVRFLGAIALPEEETCFWLYQAPSAAAVRAAMTARPACTARPGARNPGALMPPARTANYRHEREGERP